MKCLQIFSSIGLYLLIVVSCSLLSCTSDLLDENPEGFLTPDNAFQDRDGFEAAAANLYRLGRGLRTSELLSGEGDKAITAIYGSGTDLGWYWDKQLNFGNYTLINSTNALAR